MFEQHEENYKDCACQQHCDAFEVLKGNQITAERIPKFLELSKHVFSKRHSLTHVVHNTQASLEKSKFELKPVKGLISSKEYFAAMAFRCLPIVPYIRPEKCAEYSPEP